MSSGSVLQPLQWILQFFRETESLGGEVESAASPSEVEASSRSQIICCFCNISNKQIQFVSFVTAENVVGLLSRTRDRLNSVAPFRHSVAPFDPVGPAEGRESDVESEPLEQLLPAVVPCFLSR